ncbi:PTS sugar transporter subunit IIA [Sporolactobacillus nakayamae]|uniref:PTS system, ascorbate-specific IIA component n=1 Tax=Sporolactobacillus nakayamae TaxID=269670 RepID=A0A1I2V6N5_9BACL|nr:PTS sugar transporter subunit IIA [Sporolactobacillus nakayamae]SFG84069.1 PTS system, ascorbate-specific IIA component [Sporolactobacillus nakayamae]
MLSDWLQASAILPQADLTTSEAAIQVSGHLLVRNDYADKSYVTAMLENYSKNGNYIVIAPGIAIPHAAPGSMVHHQGLSLVTLKHPLNFGHPLNDPVCLVFGFCAPDHEGHLDMLMDLAALLEQPQYVTRIQNAATKEEILQIISE